MIYTITLNPSIDCYLKIGKPLMFDEVNRADEEVYKTGGKGINVSNDLSLLGISSTAIALLGGFTGRYIQESLSSNSLIKVCAIPIEGSNRINVKIHQDHKAICVNGKGPRVNECVQEDIINALSSLTDDDWVMVCGSSIKGFDGDFFSKIADIVHIRRAKLVVDMENLTLEQLKDYRPYLIKPNLYELQLIMKESNITSDNVVSYLSKACENGPENILVSMGADGAILATCDGFYQLIQPNDVAVNKVGAGDAMLAAFVGKCSEGCSFEESLCWAGAAGNAVASTLEDADLKLIQDYLPKMSVNKIEKD